MQPPRCSQIQSRMNLRRITVAEAAVRGVEEMTREGKTTGAEELEMTVVVETIGEEETTGVVEEMTGVERIDEEDAENLRRRRDVEARRETRTIAGPQKSVARRL